MQILLGIIFGVFMTVGFTYVYDVTTSGPPDPKTQTSIVQQPVVNWNVVNEKWRGWSLRVRNTWNKLAARNP